MRGLQLLDYKLVPDGMSSLTAMARQVLHHQWMYLDNYLTSVSEGAAALQSSTYRTGLNSAHDCLQDASQAF